MTYVIGDWYWRVGDTNPTTQVFSSASNAFVSNSAAAFLTWLANSHVGAAGDDGFHIAITGAADNGVGLIRLAVASTAQLSTGQRVYVSGVLGTTEANGTWAITVIDSTHLDLQTSTFANAYTSGGTVAGATPIDTAANLAVVLGTTASKSFLGSQVFYVPMGADQTLTNPLPAVVITQPTATRNLTLPVMNAPNSIPIGTIFVVECISASVGTVTVRDSSLTTVKILSPGEFGIFQLTDNSTQAGTFTAIRITPVAQSGSGASLVAASVTPSRIAATITPQGRLTLSTGVPVMTSTVSAATTVYYTPYSGNLIPLYNASSWALAEFSELSQATSDTTKSPAAVEAECCYDVFVWSDSGTMRATRGPKWTKSATITVTIATPAVVTWTGHGLSEGFPVVFTTSGALPTGITAGTVYYVGNTPGTNSFNISTSVANAAAGTFVNTSGSQSGVHTGTNNTTIRGTGSGTTELTRVGGILLNAQNITSGPSASCGTYVGTIYSNGSSQIDWIYGTNAATAVAGRLGVWNMYNRVNVLSQTTDDNTSHTYNSATVRSFNNLTTMRQTYVIGYAEDTMHMNAGGGVSLTSMGAGTNTFGLVGLAVNSTNGREKYGLYQSNGVTGTTIRTVLHAEHQVQGQLGANYVQQIEQTNATTVTFFAASLEGGVGIMGRF